MPRGPARWKEAPMLGADIARCPGRTIRVEAMETPEHWPAPHPECDGCRRREPAPEGRPWVTYMDPPTFVEGKCPRRIEP